MTGIHHTHRCASHSHSASKRTLPKRGAKRSGARYAKPEAGQTIRIGSKIKLGMQNLPGGLIVIPQVYAGRQITGPVMQAAIAGIRQLPAADLALIAKSGIKISLLPVSGLEDGLLGATTIVKSANDAWTPTEIRVAAAAGLPGGQSVGEIVQHEIGHAVAVLRGQDRSEEAAIGYARRH